MYINRLVTFSVILVSSVVHSQNILDTCKEDKCLKTTYAQSGNKRYYANIHFKSNFFVAAEYCRYNGMNLATIESAAEQRTLWNYIRSLGYGHEIFWMSGTDLGHEGSFVWLTTGLPLIYKNFLKHQPDNARGNEHCLELHGNGQWNDAPCTYNYFSVCQF